MSNQAGFLFMKATWNSFSSTSFFFHPSFLPSSQIQAPVPVTEDMQRNQMTSTTSSPGSPQDPIEVRTENLFQRTEVLAGMCHN